jgi:epoxyqueuosine reductase
MSLTQAIKQHALDLGYSKVGITSADAFPEYAAMLETRKEMYSFYIDSARRPLEGADPRNILPSAKSIISVAYDYTREAFPEEFLGKIGRAYLSRCYVVPPENINGARYELMKNFLEHQGCLVGPPIPWLPQRFAAARAGVTTYGKNNFAYVDGIGSFVILSSFVVDVELEYDRPTLHIKCPADCTKCIDACPTGAIYEPNKLDPRRCISYNNWWTNGRPGISSSIPPDLREKIGTRVHGCDVCQEVCPRNKQRLSMKLPKNAFLEEMAKGFCLAKMLNMSDEFFAERVLPLMSDYMKEKKWFQRNAAIALGNLSDSQYIPDLSRAMQDPEDVVRSYAAWALGKIGGAGAKRALESSLPRETCADTRKEIEAALAAARNFKASF